MVILIQLYLWPSMRLGLVTSILIIIFLFFNLQIKNLLKNSHINKCVLLYLSYNTLSLVYYMLNGLPISVFFREWSNSILPLFFFYLAQNRKGKPDEFYKLTNGSVLLAVVLGFYLWTSNSELYNEFLDTVEGKGTGREYFHSLFGLTATGLFGVIGFLISSKDLEKNKKILNFTMMIVFSIAVILTFRRIAIAILLFVFIVYHFLLYRELKAVHLIFIAIEILLLILTGTIFVDYFIKSYNFSPDRLLNLSSAIEVRISIWSIAFENYLYLISGIGLGAGGHKALIYNPNIISDGNYFKILLETGVVGLGLFATILISTVVRAARQFSTEFVSLGIVISFAIAAVVSNVFTYQSLAPLFWFAVGVIWNDQIESVKS